VSQPETLLDLKSRMGAAERVSAGARWLDAVAPGWESRIDPHTLEMSSEFNCICGQVFDDHAADTNESGFGFARSLIAEGRYLSLSVAKGLDEPSDITVIFGFSADARVDNAGQLHGLTYGQLHAAWLAELQARLGTPTRHDLQESR
jgi:hypothetical protein